MDISPIIISIKTATVAIVFIFLLGLLAAKLVFSFNSNKLRTIIDTIFTLPLVLPPTVAGFFLLYLLGVRRPIGQFLMDYFSVKIVFSWPATVLAAIVISFPLMYRSALAAFEQVDRDVINAARTIGMSETHIFLKILLPLAWPGVVGGGILSFARALGEFGATAMIAGNIAGKTRTLPLAIYSAVVNGDMKTAWEYVIVLIIIAAIFVIGLNVISAAQRKKHIGDGI